VLDLAAASLLVLAHHFLGGLARYARLMNRGSNLCAPRVELLVQCAGIEREFNAHWFTKSCHSSTSIVLQGVLSSPGLGLTLPCASFVRLCNFIHVLIV